MNKLVQMVPSRLHKGNVSVGPCDSVGRSVCDDGRTVSLLQEYDC